ncbi:hypothetical protein Dsin_027066 [Dipteronia sinensis]|uniref:Uncharacterized protein n=1 Tax=Dipteronia sinensis TaxID=43782 RepID=A0AAD9ZZG1_9ROSI|nr:hypothetical protein Dsin_027066 [Dipteronia sinensis]
MIAFVQLIEVRPSFLEPHLKNVNKDTDYEVALVACEFWSAYCDVQLPPENLKEFLPRLVPAKLSASGDEAWKDREAAALALGAVAEGCINGLYPRLSENP